MGERGVEGSANKRGGIDSVGWMNGQAERGEKMVRKMDRYIERKVVFQHA